MVGVERALAATGTTAAAGGLTTGAPKDTIMRSTGETPFSGLVGSLMHQTQDLGKQASDAVQGLLSGQGAEIHDVMIAQQKASVSFELALQVRNKAVAAYQQMMGMQF